MVVNAASETGLEGHPNNSVYSATKHAVIGLSKSAAGEVGGGGLGLMLLRREYLCEMFCKMEMLMCVQIYIGYADGERVGGCQKWEVGGI